MKPCPNCEALMSTPVCVSCGHDSSNAQPTPSDPNIELVGGPKLVKDEPSPESVLAQSLHAACREARKRVSAMSKEERAELLKQGMAMINKNETQNSKVSDCCGASIYSVDFKGELAWYCKACEEDCKLVEDKPSTEQVGAKAFRHAED